MRKKYLAIIVAVLVLDQLTKLYIIKNFYFGESLPVIKNIFHITYISNTGTAFGMFQKHGMLLLIFSIVAILAISVLVFMQKTCTVACSTARTFAFSLILSGAYGNLFDRVFRGEIIDFLDFRIWPIFNVADSAITVGIVMLFVRSLIHQRTGDRG